MVVNVDVSNAVFWNEGTLMNAAKELTGCGSYNDLVQKSQPQRAGPNKPLQESTVMMALRKLSKNEIVVKHKDRSQKERMFNRLAPNNFQCPFFVWLTENRGESLEDQAYCSRDRPHQEIRYQGSGH